ncbi:hypothetical protein P7C71_g535, partial [Lecanoromycetidae sp. Uapishka_2]
MNQTHPCLQPIFNEIQAEVHRITENGNRHHREIINILKAELATEKESNNVWRGKMLEVEETWRVMIERHNQIVERLEADLASEKEERRRFDIGLQQVRKESQATIERMDGMIRNYMKSGFEMRQKIGMLEAELAAAKEK